MSTRGARKASVGVVLVRAVLRPRGEPDETQLFPGGHPRTRSATRSRPWGPPPSYANYFVGVVGAVVANKVNIETTTATVPVLVPCSRWVRFGADFPMPSSRSSWYRGRRWQHGRGRRPDVVVAIVVVVICVFLVRS